MADTLDFHVVEIVRYRVTCQRCGTQSVPLRVGAVEQWQKKHREKCPRPFKLNP